MKLKIKTGIACALFFICSYGFGQISQYNYKRALTGIKDQWHKIILPDDIFGRISPDLSDIRIFGITPNHDTVEAPYLLQLSKEKILRKEVAFTMINSSKNNKGYYFTFAAPVENTVNEINLAFKQQNFDWRTDVEGSRDQQEWFSLVEGYRIVSIKNKLTDFQFTKLSFPDTRYRYYRLRIDNKTKPELVTATLSLNEVIDGNFRNYAINPPAFHEDKTNKQTIIDIDLKSPVPVCNLQILIKDRYDYYRPVTIQYLSDSFKTEQGWKYNYTDLASGTLNSLEKNTYTFNSTILKKIKIIIENQDNEPLHIDSIVVKGYIHELTARFVAPADYWLVYGKSQASKPNYDIDHFADKIPTALTTLKPGDEQSIEKQNIPESGALFQNKIWLWTIMACIILLLGWFSLSMMRKKQG